MIEPGPKIIIHALYLVSNACKVSEQGFHLAAEATSNEILAALFRAYAQQRSQFVAALRAESYRQNDGTALSLDLPQQWKQSGWSQLDEVLREKDTFAIVVACEQGESHTARIYEQVRQMHLPADIFSTLDRQYREIRKAHENLQRITQHTEVVL
jgi:uncharacterized protein (TIGR02284 family)